MRIRHASEDERFRSHPGLALYGIESYLAVPLRRRDGSYFGTLCTLDPAPTDLADDAAAIFTLLADLIAFELEADEQQRQQAAQIRTLEDVIAIAGHDLRQPLTILLGRLQLLARVARRGGLAPEELAARVDELTGQVRRAVSLSETLLDVVRLEAGGLALDLAPLDLVALARRAIDDAQIVGPQHDFRLDAPASLPTRGDERRLGQVLRNLLENAVKYAPAASGPIVVTIATSEGVRGAGEAHLDVRDAGPGVPATSLPRLFERNYREEAAISRGIGGSGLGLYIARQVIAAHGGRMWAEAAPAGGLAVRLVLPVGSPTDAPA
ncbi:MAG TPA: GAF domain-containing sensor histidine kinase [Thermomicrobiales bacterium]